MKRIENFLISDENIAYPLLFHKFAAFFPIRFLRKNYFFPNLIIFSLGTGIGYVYSLYIINTYYDVPLNIFIAGYFIFSFIVPISLHHSGELSHYISFGERLLGQISSSLYVFSMANSILFNDKLSIILCIISGMIALLSSKFSFQVISLFSLFFSLFLFSYYPAIYLIASIALAILFSRGYFFRTIKHQLIHLYVYYTDFRKSESFKHMLSKFVSIKDFIGLIKKPSPRKLLLLAKKEPLNIFFMHPESVFLVTYFIFYENIEKVYGITVFSVYLIYILTSTKYLNFIGEGFRYILFGLGILTPFLWGLIISSSQFDEKIQLLVIIIIFITIFISSNIFGVRYRDSKNDYSLDSFLKNINLPEESVIYPIPLRLAPDICARGNYKSFWWQPGVMTSSIRKKYIEEYPFPKKDFQRIIKEKNVKYIIVDKVALTTTKIKYEFHHFSEIGQDDRFIAYSI